MWLIHIITIIIIITMHIIIKIMPVVTCKSQYSIPPAIHGGYVPSPPANPKNLWIIDAVLKRLCMILYTLKYASKTHSKDSLTH